MHIAASQTEYLFSEVDKPNHKKTLNLERQYKLPPKITLVFLDYGQAVAENYFNTPFLLILTLDPMCNRKFYVTIELKKRCVLPIGFYVFCKLWHLIELNCVILFYKIRPITFK
jgi:hypothetical protein